MIDPVDNVGRIGRYKLIKRLAVGGMADIWLAQEYGSRGYERTAVVKTIRADLVDEDDLIQMLLEEARIARCLRHDNIVELYEVGEEDGTHYLAMEFVFGRDLRQVRDRCQERGEHIPHEHAVTLIAEVLDALYYAHHEATYEGRPLAVIHRDVSPHNIIVGFDGGVKLLDFGIAKATAQLSRTRAGVLKGKYAYMSPEQVDFKDLDQRADVFSAGIVLWEMLTQRRLFWRGTEYETVKAVMACEVPFPRTIRPDIPWQLSWIAYRALRRNPRWRYADAGKMRDALLRWDQRDRETARQELARWMGEIFGEELSARETALIRAGKDATRLRQIQDAGFELIDESMRRDSGPGADREHGARVGMRPVPSGMPEQPMPPVAHGMLGVIGSALMTWRWFIAVFGALVFAGVATGVYFGTINNQNDTYGYLTVQARSPGVQVVIGGRAVGEAPVEKVLVLPGRHRVTGTIGDERETVEIVVPAGATEMVKLSIPRRGEPQRE